MQSIAMEFENKKDLNEAVEKLWVERKVTGEMAIKPLSGGRWRLDLTSEVELKDKLLEKLPGKLIGDGSAGATSSKTDEQRETEANEAEVAAADDEQ